MISCGGSFVSSIFWSFVTASPAGYLIAREPLQALGIKTYGLAPQALDCVQKIFLATINFVVVVLFSLPALSLPEVRGFCTLSSGASLFCRLRVALPLPIFGYSLSAAPIDNLMPVAPHMLERDAGWSSGTTTAAIGSGAFSLSSF